MAEGRDSLEHFLACQVCFEHFEENGEHVPRILPCHHTLCEKCIREMIENKAIKCPECRKKHRATKAQNSFPQNRYILASIPGKPAPIPQSAESVQPCLEHGKELNLFCKEPGCKKLICPKSLTKRHRKHEVVDLEEGNKEVLLTNIDSVKNDLKAKIAKASMVGEDVEKKYEICSTNLKKRKFEVNREFDKMIEEVEDQRKEFSVRIKEEINIMNENLVILDNTKNSAESEEDNANEEITNKINTVRRIVESIKDLSSGPTSYREYVESKAVGEQVCGSIVRKEICVTPLKPPSLLEILGNQPGPSTLAISAPGTKQPATTSKAPSTRSVAKQSGSSTTTLRSLRNVTDASHLRFQVTQTIDIEFYYLAGPLTVLPDKRVAVCGEVNDEYKLKVYDQTTGRELSCVELEDEPFGMAPVTLGGRDTVALTYDGPPGCNSQNKIEFRDVMDLTQIVYTMDPHEPGVLCTVGPCALLYVDCSEDPREVHFLDCSAAEPKPAAGKNVIPTPTPNVVDMCCVQRGDRELLISANEDGGITTCNTETGRLEWRVEGKMPGMEEEMNVDSVATDDRGHLFVCDDANNCIHMFSVDSTYMGVALREGDQGLGEPFLVRWSETTSSLIVGHEKDDGVFVSIVSVQ